MGSYFKSYEDDIYFFIPMTVKPDDDPKKKRKKNYDPNKAAFDLISKANLRKIVETSDEDDDDEEEGEELSFGDMFCNVLQAHVEYECNHSTFRELKRIYLGEFDLACYDDDYDGTVLDIEKSYLFVTAHKKTGLYIVTVAVPNNHYIPTQLIDQMSTNHLAIKDEETGEYVLVAEYMEKRFGLIACGEAKCVICLSKEPEDRTELGYMLAAETYVSEHIDYHIRPNRIDALLQSRAYYDYYNSYISRSVIAFIFKDYSEDIEERVENEASEIFIVEIVLFQNSAVLRTNRRVMDELGDNDAITNEELEELYMEFGKTMQFWTPNVYKYPFAQLEANEVVESFGIAKTLEEYYRNQQFLDRLIELRGNIADEKSDKQTNLILYILSCIEGASITLGAVSWFVRVIGTSRLTPEWLQIVDNIAGFSWVLVFVTGAVLFKLIFDRKLRKSKKY